MDGCERPRLDQLSESDAPWAAQRFLPDKAIDLMDEACANVRVQVVPSQLLGLPSG